jgi:hypothetical protein
MVSLFPAVRLMNLISSYIFVSTSRFHSHITVTEHLKHHIFSIEIVFGLNLVTRHCSSFQKIVKLLFEVMLFSSSYGMLHPQHGNVCTCSKIVLSIYYNFTSNWNPYIKSHYFRIY